MSYYLQGIGVYHIYIVLELFLIYRVSDLPMFYRVSLSFILFTGYRAVSYIYGPPYLQGITACHMYLQYIPIVYIYRVKGYVIYTGYHCVTYLQGHMYLQYISINHIYRVSMRHSTLAYSALLLRCRCRCSAATSSFCEFYRL